MQTWQQLAGTGHLGAPASGVEDIVQHDDQHDHNSLLLERAQSNSITRSAVAPQAPATLLMCLARPHPWQWHLPNTPTG